MTNKKSGFTLVEILVVILIIGLLFVFLVPKIDSATDKARETGIKTDFRSYQTAFEAVAREQGGLGEQALGGSTAAVVVEKINYYLDPALQLTDTVAAHSGSKGAGEIAQTKTKLDPWNNNYIVNWKNYQGSNKNNGSIQIYTMGKDSKAGTGLADTPTVAYGVNATGKDWWDGDGAKNLNVPRPDAGDDGHDDYSLTTIYVDGVIYTSTTGFSTDIKPVA